MAYVANRVYMTTATTGTGTITLGAAFSNSFCTFAEAGITNGQTVSYCIEDGNDFEIGTGVYTSAGTTMTRASVRLSKIGGVSGTSKINLSGSATVRLIVAKEDLFVPAEATVTELGSSGNRFRRLFIDAADALDFGGGDIIVGNTAANELTITGGTTKVDTLYTTGTVELGHASDTTLSRDAAGSAAIEGNKIKTVGKETIYIPASAMTTRTTNGAGSSSVEKTTNKNMFRTFDFDTTTQEFVQFSVWFPKSWNLGTVTFEPVWSHPSTTTNFGVVFELAGVAISNDDPGDVAFGTAQSSTDTGGTTDDIYVGPESSAITIAGTPAVGDWVMFQLDRAPANGSDTLAVDARLHGIHLYFTTNAATDT